MSLTTELTGFLMNQNDYTIEEQKKILASFYPEVQKTNEALQLSELLP